MNRRMFGSSTLIAAICCSMTSCQVANNRIDLPPLDESREPAPSLQLRQLMQVPPGAVASWEAFRGKVVLLEFWATWCGPCIAAIPHLNELAETFAGEPVVFLSITNEENEPVESFLERREMKSWIGFDDDRRTSRDYGVTGIPHTVIVDQHGRIAAVTYPTEVTEEVIRNVIEGRDPGLPQRSAMQEFVIAGFDPASGSDDDGALLRVIIRPAEKRGMIAQTTGAMTSEGAPLRDIIPTAYGISTPRIVGLNHFGDENFTIVVRAPRNDHALMRSLLSNALEAAFQFETRRERQMRTIYELRVPDRGDHRLEPAAGGGSLVGFQHNQVQVQNQRISAVVSSLEQILEHPVYDETGLAERFDYMLRFDGDVRRWEVPERIDHITNALRDQFGLDLVPAEREIEVLVIVPNNGG